mmetsp:Transcript_12316/g.18287  ORF Transcript_12316/g.18287 Transcript_12316/m.18287 type:complete len:131 (+) Transcript_12316:1162-1554(+)
MAQYSSYDRSSFGTKPVVLEMKFCHTCLPSVDRRSQEPQNVGIYPQSVQIDRCDGFITSIEASNICGNESADSFVLQLLLSLHFDKLRERDSRSREGYRNIAHCLLNPIQLSVGTSSVVRTTARVRRRVR